MGFELCAMLCRTEEKAEKMHREYGVPVSTSAEQCIALHPDFVVVAVNKASIAAVSTEWLARGFAVLCETPAALEEDVRISGTDYVPPRDVYEIRFKLSEVLYRQTELENPLERAVL